MKSLKNIFAWAMALVLLISVCTLSVSAADFTVSVSAAASVPAGATLRVSVVVDSISVTEGLLSVDIPLDYDDTVFECVSVEATYPDEWANPQNFSYTQFLNGVFWLRMLNDEDSFGADSGCVDNGEIRFDVSLKVKPAAAPGTTEISVCGDGVYFVPCATLADDLCTPIYGEGNSISVEVTEAQALLGDVNFDGRTDNLDAAFVLRYDADLVELSAEQWAVADVNGDSAVNSIDASVILKYDAGLIEQLSSAQ